jgi:outer membrane receptor protein involved in Fe transport
LIFLEFWLFSTEVQLEPDREVDGMTKSIRLLIAVLMFACSSYLFAQATASSGIRGKVLDATGAAVVGAEVTISNSATGFSRTVKTTDDGSYTVEPVPAGVYTVKSSMSGFSAATAQKVEALVGSRTTQNFSLKAGSTTEVVEVTSQAPLFDAIKTDVSQNITPSEVQELPLLGRDAANLAYLAPGIKAADSYDPTKARMAILSVNGQTGRNVNITINGVDNKDNTVGGPVMQLPLEGVQEFLISTQRFSAANGRSEGAAINLITKSGSNLYHGSFYADFRERAFNKEQKLADGGTVQPEYERQQFGGSIGGRIIKDKLFGFFAIERNREHTSIATESDPFEDLSLVTSLGAQPSPTIPTPFFETRYNGRMDWRMNNEHSAYLSYSSQANDTLNDQSDGTADLTNGNFTVNHMQAANLTVNSALSNTLINQFTFGYQYWNNLIDSNISVPLIVFPSSSFGTNTNVPQQSYQQKWQFKDDITQIWNKHTFRTGFDYLWEPKLGGFFKFSSTPTFTFTEDPTCILGVGRNAANPDCGSANFSQGFATPGLLDSITFANGDPSFNLPGGAKQLGLYFQDDWKVTSRLTLNLGLRWDRDFNLVGGSGVDRNATVKELLVLNNPITNPYVQRKPEDQNNNFSPRVGFAYDITGKGNHVVRGGFGMYYGNIFLNIPLFMLQQGNATIFQQTLDIREGNIVPGTGILLENYRFGVDPAPTIPAPSGVLNPGSVGRLMDPDYKNPVTEQFNVGYAWQLSPASVIEAEYVHSLSLHENKTINIIQRVPVGGVCCSSPITQAEWDAAGQPRLNTIRVEKSIGRSQYDGMNLSYRQRMSNHFSLNANYTLAWARGYNSGTPASAGGASFRNYPRNAYDPFASYEYGPTGNDERHHITVSGIVELPRGFQFSPIMIFGSARPYNAVSSSNTLNTGGGTQNAVVVPNSDPTNFLAFSGANGAAQNCFYITQQCTIAKFDSLRGDAFFQLDARLAKNFKFGERMNLQLHAQAFNLTNRANYGNNFHNDIASPESFGTPAGFINPAATYVPRSLTGEFGFRFSF